MIISWMNVIAKTDLEEELGKIYGRNFDLSELFWPDSSGDCFQSLYLGTEDEQDDIDFFTGEACKVLWPEEVRQKKLADAKNSLCVKQHLLEYFPANETILVDMGW